MKYNAPLPLLQSEQLRLQTSSPHKKYIFDRILTTSFAVKHSGPAHVHLTFIFSVQYFQCFNLVGGITPWMTKGHTFCAVHNVHPFLTSQMSFVSKNFT